jgi:hypothetical protein
MSREILLIGVFLLAIGLQGCAGVPDLARAAAHACRDGLCR